MKKESKRTSKIIQLPPNHIAVLFEGAWLFTQDPDDKTRVLAICPYTNAPDHNCECGLWVGGKLVGPSGSGPAGVIDEGEHYSLDIQTDSHINQTFTKVFQTAASNYSFVYLQSNTSKPLEARSNKVMRSVSLTLPDSVRAAGELKTADVLPGDDFVAGTVLPSSAGNSWSTFVTFIFIYAYQTSASFALSGGSLATQTKVMKGNNPHLVVRVHRKDLLDDDGCDMDSSADKCHTVDTFNILRKMGRQTDTSPHKHIDIGLYHQPGTCAFDEGDSGLSYDELGLPGPPTKGADLAACAGGALVVDVGN